MGTLMKGIYSKSLNNLSLIAIKILIVKLALELDGMEAKQVLNWMNCKVQPQSSPVDFPYCSLSEPHRLIPEKKFGWNFELTPWELWCIWDKTAKDPHLNQWTCWLILMKLVYCSNELVLSSQMNKKLPSTSLTKRRSIGFDLL